MNIIKEAKKLSKAERIILVEEIWDTIGVEEKIEFSKEDKNELDESMKLIRSGKAEFVTLEEIKTSYRKRKK